MVGMDTSAQGLGPETDVLSVHTETRREEEKVQNRGNVFCSLSVWGAVLASGSSAVRAAVLL